jgi:hypothetical protein
MVAQAKATRTRKPAQPTLVEVAVLDLFAGLWTALSSDGSRWYMQDLKERTCSCPAGERHFQGCKRGACKHLLAARFWARSLASMSPAARAQALRLTHVKVHVDRVDMAALDMPLVRKEVAPAASFAALAEGFAQLPAPSFDFRSTAAA